MMSGFIYFAPGIVGAVTVYLAERRNGEAGGTTCLRRSPRTSCSCRDDGDADRRLICAVVIAPLFGVSERWAAHHGTHLPPQQLAAAGTLQYRSRSAAVGFGRSGCSDDGGIGFVERALVVDASPMKFGPDPERAEIKPQEIERAGVSHRGSLTTSGTFHESSGERVRRVRMGKNIYFDEVVIEWDKYRHLRWIYRYHDDSFPRYALDEHVVLGGHYFDIKDTSYTLIPDGNRTQIRLKMTYRVSTRFNWYADPVARLLLENLRESTEYYRRHSESGRPDQWRSTSGSRLSVGHLRPGCGPLLKQQDTR